MDYPVTFSVDYPETLNRWTTGFRIILAIPIILILALLGSTSGGFRILLLGSTSVVFLPTVLLLLIRYKYPRWWFDFALNLVRFEARGTAYVFLLRDEYPSVDDDQAVHLDVPYPNVEADLNRWLPLVKWLLAIPHYIVLFFLEIAAFFAVIVTWFAILFTGRYPRDIFSFVEGVFRWHNRVAAYAFVLVTDRYPPFRLAP